MRAAIAGAGVGAARERRRPLPARRLAAYLALGAGLSVIIPMIFRAAGDRELCPISTPKAA